MTIERTQVADHTVVALSGRMDAESAPQFQQACDAWIAEGLTSLVVDSAQLAYIGSMGLRCLVYRHEDGLNRLTVGLSADS